ncbi:hypothetical protein ACIGFL_20705 [Pseudomonas sp. NPDC077649]|uniref:hypothetical protein n=1 Tax=Pseudomonas sp. NPDC077649 TaxID=3364423 RepID=UPI0037C7AC17
MIDHLDKQTQSLPLEPKRGRGRPATGQALSNAERQRLYRERQKAQRNEKPDSHKAPYEEVVAIAQELGERCKKAEAEVERWKKLARAAERARQVVAEELAQRNDNELMKRVELAEARADAMGNELAIVKAQLSNPRKKRHRDDPPVDIREWAIQRQSPKGQWRTVAKYDTAAEANIALADQAGAMGHLYRVKAPK